MRYTDERMIEGDQRVASACEHQLPEFAGAWQSLQQELRRCSSQIAGLRVTACSLIQTRGQSKTEAELMDVFRTYHPVLSRLIAALANVLQTCRFITASASPSRAEPHLRLLLLAAEQLARERGFLAGRLCGK